MHTIMVQGILGSDPQTFTNKEGEVKGCTFRVASKERNEDVWFPVEAFGSTAKFITEYFHVGDGISIVGRMHQDKFQTKEGKNVSRLILRADQVDFLVGRRRAKEQPEVKEAEITPETAPKAPDDDDFEQIDLGELPFV